LNPSQFSVTLRNNVGSTPHCHVADVLKEITMPDGSGAHQIAEILEKSGISCWIAPRDIPNGAVWPPAIRDGIIGCTLFLLVFSSASDGSDNVLDEITLARNRHKRVLPVRICDVEPAKTELFLNTIQRFDAFERPLADYADSLVRSVQNAPAPPDASPMETETASPKREKWHRQWVTVAVAAILATTLLQVLFYVTDTTLLSGLPLLVTFFAFFAIAWLARIVFTSLNLKVAKLRKIFLIRWIGGLILLLTHAGLGAAQPNIDKFECAPERIIAGQSATLSWKVRNALKITIAPGVGAFDRQSSVTVQPLRSTAYILTAKDKDGKTSEARVSLTVVPPPRSPEGVARVPPTAVQPQPRPSPGLERVTGRCLLPPGMDEQRGFGLYSYLLLDERQNGQNRARYLVVIREVVDQLSSIEDLLRADSDLRRFNVLYIPVTRVVNIDEGDWGLAAAKILDAYDYARARILLASINAHYQRGPYLISSLQPIPMASPFQPPYLSQDMSGVDPSLAQEWVRRFIRLGAQQSPWDESLAERIASNPRNSIQQLTAVVIPLAWVRK